MTLVNIQCWHCNREGHADDEANDVGVDYLGTVSYTHLTLPTICSV